MTVFIIVFLIVGGLTYFWAGEQDLDSGGSCLLAIIVGLFWALLALFAIMR